MRKNNVHKILQGIIVLLVGTVTLQEVTEVFFTKDTCRKPSHTYVDDYQVISKDARSALHCAILSASSDCKSFFYQRNITRCVCAITYTNHSSNTTDTFIHDLLGDLETDGENTNYYLSEEPRPKTCNDPQYSWISEMKACIRVITSDTFWDSACSADGTHLLDVSSFSKSRALIRYLFCNDYLSDFWIGLNDRLVEGKYMWSNTSVVTYTNWEPNHQSTMYYSDENCGYVSYDAGDNTFYWKIKSCAFGYYKAICERP